MSAAFAACGGSIDSDVNDASDSGGAGGSGGAEGGAGADGAVDVGDGMSDGADGQDGADGGDANVDAPVQTCAACAIASYSCGQKPMESFDLVISDIKVDGCLATNPQPYTGWEFHCEPFEVCYASTTTCFPTAKEQDGTISWTPTGFPKITCYPVKKKP